MRQHRHVWEHIVLREDGAGPSRHHQVIPVKTGIPGFESMARIFLFA